MATIVDTTVNSLGAILNSKADSNSPSFTGIPVTLTPSQGDNTTQIANSKFVQSAILEAFNSTKVLFSNQFIGSGAPMSSIKLNPATTIPTKTPKSSNDTGIIGEICVDDKFLYRFTSGSRWVRIAFSATAF